jgi:rhamnogalacturonan endolyase
MFGPDPDNISFNVYRNGTKSDSSPVTNSTNYVDAGGSTGSTYTVRPVLNGQEQAASEATKALGQNYLTVPIAPPVSGYTASDCSCGDLDGDGEYEIVVKWEGATQDNANSGVTDPVCLEGYKLKRYTLVDYKPWKKYRGGAHYTQFMVYDLDGDGKAEVA